MTKLAIFLISLSFSIAINSSELTPAERMMNAMGINKLLDQSRELQSQAAKQRISIIMKQVSGTLSNPTPEVLQKIELLLQQMMNDCLNSWSTEKAIEIYSKSWTENVSEERLLELAKEFEKPETQDKFKMIMQASKNLEMYITESYNRSFQKSYSEIMPKIHAIIDESFDAKKSNK